MHKVQSTTVNSLPTEFGTMLNMDNFSGHTPLTSYAKMYCQFGTLVNLYKNLNFEGDELTVVDCTCVFKFGEMKHCESCDVK